ncbi:unnamed protein product [Musa textilis]
MYAPFCLLFLNVLGALFLSFYAAKSSHEQSIINHEVIVVPILSDKLQQCMLLWLALLFWYVYQTLSLLKFVMNDFIFRWLFCLTSFVEFCFIFPVHWSNSTWNKIYNPQVK